MQRRTVVLVSIFIALLMAEAIPFSLSESYSSPTFVATDAVHHVAQLNSNMPYIAGFHVDADDLSERETVNATAVTVSFGSTALGYFPADSWLGCGMFVQAQDHFLYNVDYGFYMMLVVNSSGTLFIDVGLHQTEEASSPIQAANSSLVYSSTWLANVDMSTEVELFQTWINSDSVRYSVLVSGLSQTLADVNVRAMPNCNNIIPQFYAGNVVVGEFPFSHCVNYFQFGIASNKIIDNSHWQAQIENPKMLRTKGWALVDKAWLLEGDHSFIDQDLMWGGEAYPGISITPTVEQSQNIYQLSFKYTGKQYSGSRTLWNVQSVNQALSFATENQDLTLTSRRLLPIIVALFAGIIVVPLVLISRKIHGHRVKQARFSWLGPKTTFKCSQNSKFEWTIE